ncbi:MAG: metal-dependent hydrolase [Candidatus Gracilibacteria bacterium]|nr:metal-dependent hydrolase [Candidatus Gracilibacteria bacterium]
MLTHSLSGYFLKKWFYNIDSKKIVLLFIFGAMFPDIDILWSYNNYNLHRVVTHSLLLLPIISIFPALIFYYIFKKEIKLKIVYLIFLSGIITHIFLDTLIIWGTPLLWPLSNNYYSLNIYTFVFEPLFIPIYLYFLLYFMKIINNISINVIKFMTIFMIFVFFLKFSLLYYVSNLSTIKNNTIIGVIKSPSDLVLQRYYNSFSNDGDKIHGELIDLYTGTIIERYDKEIFIDDNSICSNLHNGFLFTENGFVGDIRYGISLGDNGNCFFGMKIY